MAADNNLRVTIQRGRAEVSWRRISGETRLAPAIVFDTNVGKAARLAQDMKWYHDSYLKNSLCSAKQKKARHVRRHMRKWGQTLFEVLFFDAKSREAFIFFNECVRDGLDTCEFVVASDDPSVLDLPWELICSPDQKFFASHLYGLYRTLNSCPIFAPLPCPQRKSLHILLIIARPVNHPDFRAAGKPILEIIRPLRIMGRVTLKVLRPPTFDNLVRELNEKKGYYNVVHFNGHGENGKLVFECPTGKKDQVSPARIGRSLYNCRVPVFFLDACESGYFITESIFQTLQTSAVNSPSSVPTELLRVGTAAVVAMSFEILVESAKIFMMTVYEELLRGKVVSAAVASGRKLLLSNPFRGGQRRDFEDWMVPVLYQEWNYAHVPFILGPKSATNIQIAMGVVSESRAEKMKLIGIPEASCFEFIGREDEILKLERSFQQRNIILMRGDEGVGKTELCYEWARWLVHTSGRKEVFYVSFKAGQGLRLVLKQIGKTVMDHQFAVLEFEIQRRLVLKYLRRHPCLLIWDNFERVTKCPAEKVKCQHHKKVEELSRFVKKLERGQTWVLVSSRQDERQLECTSQSMVLKCFAESHAQEFAKEVWRQIGMPGLQLKISRLVEMADGNPRRILRKISKGIKAYH